MSQILLTTPATETDVANSADTTTNVPSGILVLDKPPGLSSNQVLQKVKRHFYHDKKIRQTKTRFRVGYLGTLDPLATGVLVMFIGNATRLIHLFEKLPKRYQAIIKLGEQTDTLDAEGTMLSCKSPDHLTPQQINDAVLAWHGEHNQQTPDFSAVKKNGIPAYKLARKGEIAHHRTRKVCFHLLEVQKIKLPYLHLDVLCSAGTYIRSLANDIGTSLKVGAHLTSLKRTAIGSDSPSWNIKQAVNLSELLKSPPCQYILNPVPFLTNHAPVEINPENLPHLLQGRLTPFTTPDNLTIDKPLKALNQQGRLLAIGTAIQTSAGLQIQPRCVLVE